MDLNTIRLLETNPNELKEKFGLSEKELIVLKKSNQLVVRNAETKATVMTTSTS